VYLKRLELFGFKTFSKKTVIEYPHGFMAVVGPNGSGKSNLTDAIRFCLGESQVKALRATKLDELIFAGTPDKQPAAYCEVTVVFDNTDGTLPMDLSEVAITRRLTRDGGSKFALNGATCRLKDIHEMLMGSGVGPGSFFVLGGKEVDRVLSNDPKDRRMMLEETASVNRYRYRKKEAARKLDQTEDNLIRLKDILKEVGEQLNESKRQLQRYERYKASKDELANLQRRVALHDVTSLRTQAESLALQVRQIQDQMGEAKEREVLARQAMECISADKESADREREKLSAQLSALRERTGATTAAQKSLGARRKQLRDQLKNSGDLVETGADRVQSQMERITTLSNRRGELNTELGRARQHLEMIAEELGRLPSEAGGEPAAELRNRQGSFLKRRQLLTEEASRDQAEEAADFDRKEELEFRRLELNDEKESRTPQNETVEFFDLESVEAEHAELLVNIEKLKSRRDQFQGDLVEQIANGRELENHRRPLVARIAEYEALAEDRTSLPPSVRTVLSWQDPGVVGLVGDLVKVPSGLEVAFEAALGGSVNNIITRDKRTASDLINELKKQRVGRCTFWPLDLKRNSGRKPDIPDRRGVIGWALELLGYPQEIEQVLQQLLGRTVIMEDMPTALALYDRCYGSRPHLVTKGGEYLNPSGALTGGVNRTNRSGLLAARSKLNQARQDLSALEQASMRVVQRIEKIQNGLEEAETALRKRQERLHEVTASLAQGRAQDQELSRQKERLQSELSRLDTEIQKLLERQTERAARGASRENELEKISQELAALESELTTFRQQESELTQKREAMRGERMQAELRVERAQERIADLERERTREEERLSDLRGDRARSEQDLARCKEGLSAIDDEEKRLEIESVDLVKRVDAKTEELRQVRLSHQAIDEKAERLNKDFGRAAAQLQKYNSELHRIELDRTKVTTLYEESIQRLSDGKMNREELLQLARQTEPLSPEEMIGSKTRIGHLKHFLDNFGGVNLGAREDFDRLQGRYQGLETQIIDLVEGKDSLEKIMRELDEATTHLFIETFHQVNDTFGKLFTDLFGGGTAELVLCDPDDPLDSGVDIVACPPGKRQQNMMLMSSGERALSAIAFLMSLLACKPSPIVILDELDAPLDERNVEKVATRLLEFSSSSQFLVVTHNRKTMEFADLLYGVTMTEPGVSRVLTVELSEVEEKLGALV
jgi:chromosome segregation protein